MSRYLTNDKFRPTSATDASKRRAAGCGQPAESLPILWNVMFYDDFLYIYTEKDTKMIGSSRDDPNEKDTLHRLRLANEKTEELILRGKRNRDGIAFWVGTTNIEPRCSVRYLRLTFDTCRCFGTHVVMEERAEEKAGKFRSLRQGRPVRNNPTTVAGKMGKERFQGRSASTEGWITSVSRH